MPKIIEVVSDQEWGNAQQVFARFGLARSTLIKLADSGQIQSVRIKTKLGSRKTVRLFRIESIRALLGSETFVNRTT